MIAKEMVHLKLSGKLSKMKQCQVVLLFNANSVQIPISN